MPGKTQPTGSDSNTKLLEEILDSYWDSTGFIPDDDLRARLRKEVEEFRNRIKKPT